MPKPIYTKPFDLIVQVEDQREKDHWLDFSSIRSEEDLALSIQLVEGTHPSFTGTYRIVNDRNQVVYPES